MSFSEFVNGSTLCIRNSDQINISELVVFLQEKPEITKLTLRKCNIGDEEAKILANFTHLTDLNLMDNNIGDEGAEALANSNIKNVYLAGNKEISYTGVKAIAESKNSVRPPLIDNHKFYYQLKNLWNEERKENTYASKLSDNKVKTLFFEFAQKGDTEKLKLFLNDSEKYPFLINSKNEQGYTLAHFYNHDLEMRKVLFECGMVTLLEAKQEENSRLQQIVEGAQNIHEVEVDERIRFFTKKVLEDVKATKEQLENAANSFLEEIKKFCEEYYSESIICELLCIDEAAKRFVKDTEVTGINPTCDNQKFIQEIVTNTIKTLEDKYLKEVNGNYQDPLSQNEIKYDREDDTKTVKIPQCIGCIKLLIDKCIITLTEKKELLVTLMEKKPDLVKQRLPKVTKVLGKNEQLNRANLYKLLDNIENSEKIDNLFQIISGQDIKEIWKKQKYFSLIEGIYMAATAYPGRREDMNSCIGGTWTHIMNSINQISTDIVEQYDNYSQQKKELEKKKSTITGENIEPFVESLADHLIKFVETRPELQETLEEFVTMWMIDVINYPDRIELKPQKIVAEINKYFSENIKGYLPNYNRDLPTKDEYDIIITELSKVKAIKDFVKQQNNLQDGKEQSRGSSYTPDLSNDSGGTGAFVTSSIMLPDQQRNNSAVQDKKKHRIAIPIAAIAVAGVIAGIVMATHFKMLKEAIVIGVCSLAAAAIAVSVYCLYQPSESLDNVNSKGISSNAPLAEIVALNCYCCVLFEAVCCSCKSLQHVLMMGLTS